MSDHSFSFSGGADLSKIGAGWFVSYAYYKNIDSAHQVWNQVDTIKLREKVYENLSPYHDSILREVLMMDDKKLNTGSLRLGSSLIKQMALDLLKKEAFKGNHCSDDNQQ